MEWRFLTLSFDVERQNIVLSGYAWSPYGGWLSFNEKHNNEGANVQPDGTVTGWAKFVSDGQGRGLDRLVSLSRRSDEQYDYGLYYATTTVAGATIGQLRGFAWGGNVVGWMTFGGPILKNVVQNANGTFDITYENPITYSEVQIFFKEESGPFFLLRPSSYVSQGGPYTEKNVSVPNVKPNANYQFKVRGILP